MLVQCTGHSGCHPSKWSQSTSASMSHLQMSIKELKLIVVKWTVGCVNRCHCNRCWEETMHIIQNQGPFKLTWNRREGWIIAAASEPSLVIVYFSARGTHEVCQLGILHIYRSKDMAKHINGLVNVMTESSSDLIVRSNSACIRKCMLTLSL